MCAAGLQWADKVYALHTPSMIWPPPDLPLILSEDTKLIRFLASNLINLGILYFQCNGIRFKSARRCWRCLSAAFWTSPWLTCQLSRARKYPNIAPTNPNLFQRNWNWITFLENLHAPFSAGLRVIKGRSRLKWGKVKLWSCKSERIVPIWGVVRKSKCQLGRKSGVSERRNPFLGFEQIWRLQIQRWGRLKLGEGLRARPPLLRSILCFAS